MVLDVMETLETSLEDADRRFPQRFCPYAPMRTLISLSNHACSDLPGVAIFVSKPIYETARRDAERGLVTPHMVGSAIVGLSGLACPVAVFYTWIAGAPLRFAFNATDNVVRTLMHVNCSQRSFPIALLRADGDRQEPVLGVAPDNPVFQVALEDTDGVPPASMQSFLASAPLALAVVSRRMGLPECDVAIERLSWICLTQSQYPT